MKNFKKIAVIELNSTNIRLVVADVLENQSFVAIERREEPIKLASDLACDELIKQSNIFAVTKVLQMYKAMLSSYGVKEVYALANSEYADAKNQRSFFDEIFSSTGFRFKILSADEQTNNLYLSFINSMDCPKGLILNINGTTLQLLAYNRRNFVYKQSFNVGSVSLADKYMNKDIAPSKAMQLMTEEVEKLLSKIDWFENLDEETQIVGTGDVFLSLSKLSRKLRHYPFDKDHAYQFDAQDFDKVYDFVKTLDIDKTKKLKGISSQRADILASGLSIIKAVANASKIKRFIISENGVAEGQIFSKVVTITNEKPISDVLGYSLETNCLYYDADEYQNIHHVCDLSLILFKQLKVLHKLPRNFVKVLRIASYMNECGKRINPNDYQKHGFSVVLNSEIYGASHSEQVLASFVVACQKLEDFSMTEWVKYSSMFSDAELDGMRKLAIIIRLASLLDIFHLGKVRDISCDILGDSVIMKTIVESPADLEISQALKVSADFAKAFKKHLEIL